eukprot:743754_1
MSLSLATTILYFLLLHTTKTTQFIDCTNLECKLSYIICVDNENCDIDCSLVDGACQSSIIYCPENGNCNIQCDSQEACDKMTIYAQKSSSLTLSCQSHLESCYFMDIYCPQNKGDKTCTISGFDDFFEMAIYAVNGFNDVHFDVFTSLPSTSIHCSSDITTSTFDTSCVVSPTFPHTECINNVTECYPEILTAIPTSIPTKPTANPSISPTFISTESPTIEPSIEPSIFPTFIPTIVPTLIPTQSQIDVTTTEIPTYFPTIVPTQASIDVTTTKSPTDFPTIIPTIIPTIAPTLTLTSSNPTKSPSQTPTIHVEQTTSNRPTTLTRRPIRTRYHSLMTTTPVIDRIRDTIEYQNDTNEDTTASKIKPITINLTNLLYVVAGIVVTCCVVCGFCFIKNNVYSHQSDQQSESKTKWSDWNNHEFIFRHDLNSGSSDIESPSSKIAMEMKEEEDLEDDGLHQMHMMMDEKKIPDSVSDYGSETKNELSHIIRYVTQHTKGYRMGLGESIPPRINEHESSPTEYNVQDDAPSDDGYKVSHSAVDRDEFCMKLVDYILDDKTLNNNIISDMLKDPQ